MKYDFIKESSIQIYEKYKNNKKDFSIKIDYKKLKNFLSDEYDFYNKDSNKTDISNQYYLPLLADLNANSLKARSNGNIKNIILSIFDMNSYINWYDFHSNIDKKLD